MRDDQKILFKLYPEADPLSDYIVVDGRISHWDQERLGEQPTEEKLKAEWVEVRRGEKIEEMAEYALEEIRGLFRTSLPSYEVLGIHNAKLLSTSEEDYPPRYTAAMELIRETNVKLERKLHEVATAEDPETVTWQEPDVSN